MKTSEYQADLFKLFEKDDKHKLVEPGKFEVFKLGKFDCFYARVKTGHIAKTDIFTNPISDKEVPLLYVGDYISAIKDYLLQHYSTSERARIVKIGLAAIISQTKISDAVKVYVKSNIERDITEGIFVLTLLVDLEAQNIAVPIYTGFLNSIPVTNSINFAKNKFSLEGRLKIM